MYEALSYQCMRPYATSVCGLKLLVYEALRYKYMRPEGRLSKLNTPTTKYTKTLKYIQQATEAAAAAAGERKRQEEERAAKGAAAAAEEARRVIV